MSSNQNRELDTRHYQLPVPWGEARVCDTIHLGLQARCPECHHPEDWALDSARWSLAHRPSSDEELLQLRTQLIPALYQENLLFGSADDHIPFSVFEKSPAAASLALIKPDRFSCCIIAKEGKRRYRACFTYRSIYYDIGITDQVWEQRMAGLAIGHYSQGAAGVAYGSEIWVTASLGEPFQGDCFKLAAAIIVWPPECVT